MAAGKDRFGVHFVMRHNERADMLARSVAGEPLKVAPRPGWNGANLNIYDVAGVVDGADLSLLLSTVSTYRDSLDHISVSKVLSEGTM